MMNDSLKHLAYEVELSPGEKLTLPPRLVESIGAGRWVITIQPADAPNLPIRAHGAFLNGYSSEDEGLYDDDRGR